MRPWTLNAWPRLVLIGYSLLLVTSYVVCAVAPGTHPPPTGAQSSTVRAVRGEQVLDVDVRVAYRELSSDPSAPVVILVQGSTGDTSDAAPAAATLARHFRVLVPDLPGFGGSTKAVPDYSVRAHARYLLALMDRLDIAVAHVIGVSMGGVVALNMVDLAPERVRSVTMLSAIGVQELELLGEYHVNHLLRGLQLGTLTVLSAAVPHFGLLDASAIPYARTFYDSDLRPLRQVLARHQGPMLILHGKHDARVAAEAAVEHARIVPHAELELLDADHNELLRDPEVLAGRVRPFLERVEMGRAVTRSAAPADRVEAASRPFDAASLPKFTGVAVLVVVALLALATFVSEDLACVTAGVLAAQGRLDFWVAAFACMVGIYVGDLLLFFAGRWLGRRAVTRAPLRWFVKDADVERCSRWLERRGAAVILISRFLPGTRLPTYFAAGLLETSAWRFSLYFLVATALWTPALVAASTILGTGVLHSAPEPGAVSTVAAVVVVVIAYAALRLALTFASHRRRQLLGASVRRLARWEFWPPWIFYPPVLCYIALLALRYRSITLFTAANPGIEDGGFVGESKSAILARLAGAEESVARWTRVDESLEGAARVEHARTFQAELARSFPLVLKPDVGQRGEGVRIARSDADLEEYFAGTAADTIVQEYVPGVELGVFYYRFPGEEHGTIFSITFKQFPSVTGDGRRTLEQLVLDDPRAVLMARAYFERHADRLGVVPAKGEAVRLVDIGTHCRGALFLDGGWLETAALRDEVDRISHRFHGFYFGRYDLRGPSVESFQRGEGIRVVELNGVTSEATHIYDPKSGLLDAYRVVFEQWRLAFAIGAANQALGARPTPLSVLARRALAFLRGAERGRYRRRPGTVSTGFASTDVSAR